MRFAYREASVLPDFLYHFEPAGPLDNHALACRLSYFFWRSLPDEKLTQLAEAGKLRESDVLRAETSGCSPIPGRNGSSRTFSGSG